MENILDILPKYRDSDKIEIFDCNNGSFIARITDMTKKEYVLRKMGFNLLFACMNLKKLAK